MGTTSARTRRRGRRHGQARSLSPTVAVTVIALLVGGAGIADAATGGNFILGRANRETSTASLSDSNGTPLKLLAPTGKAPLAVNRTTMITNLNAQYVGGLGATALAATGGDGFTQPPTDASLSPTAVQVVSTGALPAGTYYVTATAQLHVAAGDNVGLCWIGTSSKEIAQGGGATQQGWVQAAETAAVAVPARGTVQQWCVSGGSNGSFAFNAGITAIRVLTSSGTSPASVGR